MKEYRDIDTNEIYTEEELRDWFYSLEEEDRYGDSPEDYIFINMKENGGGLEEVR